MNKQSKSNAKLQLLVEQVLELVKEEQVDDREISKSSEPAEAKSVFQKLDGKIKQVASYCFDTLGGTKAAAIVGGVAFVLMLGVVFYLKSDGRTVEVTMDDPTAKIFIDGNHVEIDGATGKVTLDVGNHEVTVKKDGVKVKGWDKFAFKVEAKKKNLLTIRLLDKAVDVVGGSKPQKKQPRAAPPLDTSPNVQ